LVLLLGTIRRARRGLPHLAEIRLHHHRPAFDRCQVGKFGSEAGALLAAIAEA